MRRVAGCGLAKASKPVRRGNGLSPPRYRACVSAPSSNGSGVRRLRRWLVASALLVIALAVLLPSAWIETGYSRAVFAWIQACLVPVFGCVPFPVMGAVLALLPIAVPAFAVWRWRRARRSGASRRATWFAGTMRTLRTALYVYALFLLLWGTGYRRVPIEQRWQLPAEMTYEDVRNVQHRLLAVLHRDGTAPSGPAAERRAVQAMARSAQELVHQLEGFAPALPAHLKYPPEGLLMAIGIYGVVSPFTLEANLDPALPEAMRIAVGGHELAHILGYCGEADANLVSFVAGLRADDPLTRYSTALSMMRYAMSPKHAQDALWLMRHLPRRAKDDLAALRNQRQKHTVKAVSRLTHAVNDTYLKAQGVKLGTDDYARGFTLFVRAYQRGLLTLPEPFAVAPRENK